MTNDAVGKNVRLPADRRGTVVKVYERENGAPPAYDVEADEGEIITMVEIAESSLIPREDYDRLIALARGIEDGTITTIDVTEWTDEQVWEQFSRNS